MNYQLVLSDLKFVNLDILLAVSNDVSCTSLWGKYSLTIQCLIPNDDTKITQFVTLYRIMN